MILNSQQWKTLETKLVPLVTPTSKGKLVPTSFTSKDEKLSFEATRQGGGFTIGNNIYKVFKDGTTNFTTMDYEKAVIRFAQLAGIDTSKL